MDVMGPIFTPEHSTQSQRQTTGLEINFIKEISYCAKVITTMTGTIEVNIGKYKIKVSNSFRHLSYQENSFD